jgi:hypothetical protein
MDSNHRRHKHVLNTPVDDLLGRVKRDVSALQRAFVIRVAPGSPSARQSLPVDKLNTNRLVWGSSFLERQESK